MTIMVGKQAVTKLLQNETLRARLAREAFKDFQTEIQVGNTERKPKRRPHRILILVPQIDDSGPVKGNSGIDD